jgi:hypothetical protein
MYFALFNSTSLAYWIPNRGCDCAVRLFSGSAAVVSKKSGRDLSLRVINPPVRMPHNETKPLDPAVRHPLVGGPWRMAMVG